MKEETKYCCAYCGKEYGTIEGRTSCEMRCQEEYRRSQNTKAIKDLREKRDELRARERSIRRNLKKLQQEIEAVDKRIEALLKPENEQADSIKFSINGVEVSEDKLDAAISSICKLLGLD